MRITKIQNGMIYKRPSILVGVQNASETVHDSEHVIVDTVQVWGRDVWIGQSQKTSAASRVYQSCRSYNTVCIDPRKVECTGWLTLGCVQTVADDGYVCHLLIVVVAERCVVVLRLVDPLRQVAELTNIHSVNLRLQHKLRRLQ